MSNGGHSARRSRTRVAVALKRGGDSLSKFCLALSAVAIFVIIAINGGNVASRHFFGFAWSWAEEAMLFAMIFGVFAGAASATWHGSHMHFDMFLGYLPSRWRAAAVILTGLLSTGILIVLANSSYRVVSMLYSFGQTSVALGFPMWIAQGCVFVGLILVAAMILMRLAVFGAGLAESEFDDIAEPQP